MPEAVGAVAIDNIALTLWRDYRTEGNIVISSIAQTLYNRAQKLNIDVNDFVVQDEDHFPSWSEGNPLQDLLPEDEDRLYRNVYSLCHGFRFQSGMINNATDFYDTRKGLPSPYEVGENKKKYKLIGLIKTFRFYQDKTIWPQSEMH